MTKGVKMNIARMNAEAKCLRDAEYARLTVEGTLTTELKKFIREQTLNGLYELQIPILDGVNNGDEVKIKGEFEYLAKCIGLKSKLDAVHVTKFNDKNTSKFTTPNGTPRKHGFVASFVQFMSTEVLEDVKPQSHVFAKTKTEALKLARAQMLEN